MDQRLAAATRQGAGLVTTAAVLQSGVSRGALRWAVSHGELVRVERGAFVSTAVWNEADPRTRHLLRIRAAQVQAHRAVAVAWSAAVVWGLPLPATAPAVPQLLLPRTGNRAGGRGHRAGTTGRCAWLDQDEVRVTTDGIRVTTPQRTVVDCARHLDRPWSLAVADAAVRDLDITRRELEEAAARNPSAPGHPAAVWVARYARPEVESPLESLARAVVILDGHEPPLPQVWLRTERGDVRVDLTDPTGRVVIEADGRVKYTDPAVVWQEKLREDAIRATGREVLRFTYADYRRPGPWLARYRRALVRTRGPGSPAGGL